MLSSRCAIPAFPSRDLSTKTSFSPGQKKNHHATFHYQIQACVSLSDEELQQAHGMTALSTTPDAPDHPK